MDLCGYSIAAAAKLTALTHLRLGVPDFSTLQDMPCLSQLTRLETFHLNLRGGYNLQVRCSIAVRTTMLALLVCPSRLKVHLNLRGGYFHELQVLCNILLRYCTYYFIHDG